MNVCMRVLGLVCTHTACVLVCMCVCEQVRTLVCNTCSQEMKKINNAAHACHFSALFILFRQFLRR